MTSVTDILNEVSGAPALHALYDQGCQGSPQLEKSLAALWRAYGSGPNPDLKPLLEGPALDYVIGPLFNAANPNNKVDCFFLGNAMVHVNGTSREARRAIDTGTVPDRYSQPPLDGDYVLEGHTRWVFEQAAKRFEGAQMAVYANAALEAKHSDNRDYSIFRY
jgi:hypothetical protein